MGKPIYRVIVKFQYRNTSNSSYIKARIKIGHIDTFALSRNKEEILEHIKPKVLSKINKKENEVEIKILDYIIEGQYGETNY
jgi:hypothetical protein